MVPKPAGVLLIAAAQEYATTVCAIEAATLLTVLLAPTRCSASEPQSAPTRFAALTRQVVWPTAAKHLDFLAVTTLNAVATDAAILSAPLATQTATSPVEHHAATAFNASALLCAMTTSAAAADTLAEELHTIHHRKLAAQAI